MISAKTRICGLIGDPVVHSVSPVMHNASFKKLGLDYIYLPFKVETHNLYGAIAGVKTLGIRGFNVTIPHKVAVIPLLDELESLAMKIGAVNTIVNDEGCFKGYNTDADGFLKALLEKDIQPKGKKAIVLGAGGASRAISFILAEKGAEIVILNRKLELNWALELANKISLFSKTEARAMELTDDNLSLALDAADILVNATSVGMSPNIDRSLVPKNLLKPGLVVFDAVYNPLKTRLLSDAELAGAKTISGIEMLVWQGALAFELWTGFRAPLDVMKKEAIKLLKDHED
ncbi:MAG: shikimate dehydrogenase [Dehalococcoidia bacterium]|nr:MAG: shikimate dehydrogenase [Dehalococcoidia bacterium]